MLSLGFGGWLQGSRYSVPSGLQVKGKRNEGAVVTRDSCWGGSPRKAARGRGAAAAPQPATIPPAWLDDVRKPFAKKWEQVALRGEATPAGSWQRAGRSPRASSGSLGPPGLPSPRLPGDGRPRAEPASHAREEELSSLERQSGHAGWEREGNQP